MAAVGEKDTHVYGRFVEILSNLDGQNCVPVINEFVKFEFL